MSYQNWYNRLPGWQREWQDSNPEAFRRYRKNVRQARQASERATRQRQLDRAKAKLFMDAFIAKIKGGSHG